MKIKFKCQCGKRIKVPAEKAYNEIECPLCQANLLIPSAQSTMVLEYECDCGRTFKHGPKECPGCGASLYIKENIKSTQNTGENTEEEKPSSSIESRVADREENASKDKSQSLHSNKGSVIRGGIFLFLVSLAIAIFLNYPNSTPDKVVSSISPDNNKTGETAGTKNNASKEKQEIKEGPKEADKQAADSKEKQKQTKDSSQSEPNQRESKEGPKDSPDLNSKKEPIPQDTGKILDLLIQKESKKQKESNVGKILDILIEKGEKKEKTPHQKIDEVYFSKFIHPILIKECASPACHSGKDAGGYLLLNSSAKEAINKNFIASSEFIKFKSPDKSSLLLKTLSQKEGGIEHGGGVIYHKSDRDFQYLLNFVNGDTDKNVPEVNNQPLFKEEPDFAFFTQKVQPLLSADCAFSMCHVSDKGGRYILKPGDTEEEIRYNYEASIRFVRYKLPEESHLLMKPLSHKEGGIPHQGGTRFRKGDDAYKILVDFINGAKETPQISKTTERKQDNTSQQKGSTNTEKSTDKAQTEKVVQKSSKVIEPEDSIESFFRENVHKTLIQRCSAPQCHGGEFGGSYRLITDNQASDKSPSEQARVNYRNTLKFINKDFPEESPLIKKPLNINDGGWIHGGENCFEKNSKPYEILSEFAKIASKKGSPPANKNPSAQKQTSEREESSAFSFFEKKIQPLLVGCSIQSCHGGYGAGKFHLISADSQKSTYTNYRTVLNYINSRSPGSSPLLIKPLKAKDGGISHGGGELFGKSSYAYKVIYDFINENYGK